MTLPARPQTFGLENAWDLYAKLEWEIEKLKAAPVDRDPQDLAYGAFNAAVTAWQLMDWVWKEIDLSKKKRLSLNNLGDLQRLCRNQCRALYLCRQIATASKHWEVRDYADPSVQAKMDADVRRFSAGDPVGTPLSTWRWNLIIHDGAQTFNAIQVFDDAQYFWGQFMMKHLPRPTAKAGA